MNKYHTPIVVRNTVPSVGSGIHETGVAFDLIQVLHNRCNENHHCNPVTWARMNMVGYFLSAPKPSLKPQNTFRAYFGRADSGELLIQS